MVTLDLETRPRIAQGAYISHLVTYLTSSLRLYGEYVAKPDRVPEYSLLKDYGYDYREFTFT